MKPSSDEQKWMTLSETTRNVHRTLGKMFLEKEYTGSCVNEI